jgi:glycosyltransferase involved in cell wall biosynthesis
MKILVAHNRYQQRGGEDESTSLEVALLKSRGHEVIEFVEDNQRISRLTSLEVASRTIWSQESYRRLRRRIREQRPDLVHLQNFFPLISPAAYYAARAEGVPVVQTLRNYRLLCPNALFFRDGHACEDCLGKALPWPGVVHACYRGNRAATGVVAAMLVTHRGLRTWKRMVDTYVALTDFARQKFIQGGIPSEKIIVKPNFVHPDPGPGGGRGGYALFVGRLSPEKGIGTVLAAWEQSGEPLALKIVGDGPLAGQVIEAAKRLPRVEWLGRRPVEEVYRLMGEASVVIFPSEWYETFGRVAVEAFAKGTPLIAANIGAIAELVDHGRTGLYFRPGDPKDLAAQVEWILSHPTELAEMRRAARAEFEAKYTAERNYRMLTSIYRSAIARAGARTSING